MTTMTTKQRDYLISLVNGRRVSDVAYYAKTHGISMTMTERSGSISKARASELITAIKDAK